MKLLLILASLISFQVFAQFAGAGSSSGGGNPASIFCIENGGTVIIKNSHRGAYGICQIEEWTLFNLFIDRNMDTPDGSGQGDILSMGNPAAKLCEAIKGKSYIIETPEGQTGLCDIEEWTLFRMFQ